MLRLGKAGLVWMAIQGLARRVRAGKEPKGRRKDMIYQWKTIKYKVDPQIAGEEVERIASQKPLTPEVIVDESKPRESPLHTIFEWDNEKAGQEWRKQQARVMLGNLVTVRIDETDLEEPTRAFVDLSTRSEYTSVEIVLNEPALYRDYVAQAIKELESFKKKYEGVQALKSHYRFLERFETAVCKAEK